ncbi:MBL fold metallo-hydrolase [Clostridium pasteurianum]|uniref:Zn-dependent hydrolase of beta-lactamase fold protein n=1 Tax=Clostridium pasteurianum BC1 TaxID=86416 RepID=R4K6R8_CLOPA|nr:MBL fold metallo-hydrolase [Clostridium pasteurianum]AGK95335.1 hypothetical protein Clopa_0271 [Clostridium pasteurianum BC1]
MEIAWLGHSSFLIKDSRNRLILTDPFNDQVGYETYKGNANFVTISHSHFDHAYTDEVKGNPKIINTPGNYNFDDLNIIGVNSYHDKQLGAVRGKNIIFIIEVDGYRICHLGDLGYILSDEEVTALGAIDVLLVPVGGNFTINGVEAKKLCEKINSHLIIPMHYKTPLLSFPIDGVENFISAIKNGERLQNNTLKLESKLTENNNVKILTAN